MERYCKSRNGTASMCVPRYRSSASSASEAGGGCFWSVPRLALATHVDTPVVVKSPAVGCPSMASELYFAAPRAPSLDISPHRRGSHDRRRKRPAHFLDLPYEVLIRILEFSCDNAEELVNFSLVCSAMNRFAAVESLWKRVCLNRYGFVHPSTVTQSGSWRTLIRNKALIENSPWTVKPLEASNMLQNDVLGASSREEQEDRQALQPAPSSSFHPSRSFDPITSSTYPLHCCLDTCTPQADQLTSHAQPFFAPSPPSSPISPLSLSRSVRVANRRHLYGREFRLHRLWRYVFPSSFHDTHACSYFSNGESRASARWRQGKAVSVVGVVDEILTSCSGRFDLSRTLVTVSTTVSSPSLAEPLSERTISRQ